jgi:hypothetical protein
MSDYVRGYCSHHDTMTNTALSKRSLLIAVTALIVAALSLASASSQASTLQSQSSWTVTQAERWIVQHVTYFDREAANKFLAEWDDRHAAVEEYCSRAAANPSDMEADEQCRSEKQQFRSWLSGTGISNTKRPTAKQVGTVAATGSSCRSDSPSSDSYHFWRFRCRVQFGYSGYGIARLTVTGPRSAVWRWL